ncbi:MAG TPA: zinc ribbon domain-containing protein [Ktedonobacterales bacterium]
MNCANCGNTLSPGSVYCAACGASTAAPTTSVSARAGLQQSAGVAEQPESVPAGARTFRARTVFYGRYGTRGSVALPTPSSLTPSATRPEGNGSPESNGSRNGSSSTTLPLPSDKPAAGRASAHASGQMPALSAPLTPGHTRLLAGRLVALGGIVLLLALLAPLTAFGYHAYKKAQSETRAAANGVARVSATGTAAAQATATARTPLLIDSLASNTNGWLTNGAAAFFAGGQYHLHNPNPTTTLNSYYQQQTFDNFTAQITVTAYSDANPNAEVPYAYGLVLRAAPSTPTDKYVFFVSPAGTYNFARHDQYSFFNNGWSDLSAIPWASSSAIHTGKGATNTLKVIARDNTFTLFINGQQVEVVSDNFSGYESGWIGVMVEGADMEAGFSNLSVYGPGV